MWRGAGLGSRCTGWFQLHSPAVSGAVREEVLSGELVKRKISVFFGCAYVSMFTEFLSSG